MITFKNQPLELKLLSLLYCGFFIYSKKIVQKFQLGLLHNCLELVQAFFFNKCIHTCQLFQFVKPFCKFIDVQKINIFRFREHSFIPGTN